jgi:hypothetical protein
MEKKIAVTKTTKYVAKTFKNLEEMPSEVRQAYEQAMAASGDPDRTHRFTNVEKIVIDGKEYASVDEMPPGVHRSYEQMQGMINDALENQKTAEVTEIIFNDKKYASVEEMPLALRETYVEAMTGSSEIPGNSLKTILSGLPTRHRTITIIEGRSEDAEDADEETKKPGLDSFLAILAGITVLYLMYLLIPGRHEPWAKFIARQPTWGNFFKGWTFIVLPIASLLWLGFYCSGRRFSDALSLAVKILMVGLILLIIAMVLSAVNW